MESSQQFKTLKRYETGSARLLNFSCYQNRPFFRHERACQWFVEALGTARDKHAFRLGAYVVMPTHVHLLIVPKQAVPPILKSIKQSVANKAVRWAKHHDPGLLDSMTSVDARGTVTHRFWQRGGGYDRNLSAGDSIEKAIDYIHNNPVRAKLCQRPEGWQWSSAAWFSRERGGGLEMDRLDCSSVRD